MLLLLLVRKNVSSFQLIIAKVILIMIPIVCGPNPPSYSHTPSVAQAVQPPYCVKALVWSRDSSEERLERRRSICASRYWRARRRRMKP